VVSAACSCRPRPADRPSRGRHAASAPGPQGCGRHGREAAWRSGRSPCPLAAKPAGLACRPVLAARSSAARVSEPDAKAACDALVPGGARPGTCRHLSPRPWLGGRSWLPDGLVPAQEVRCPP
jgi:hypothetical protein